MKCASCGYNSVPEGARVCPECEQELPQGNASPVTINVEQNVGRVEEGGTVTGVTLEEPKGPVTVILNITIKLFEPLLAFLERYWPILVAILISDVVVLAAYLYLDPTFWIRRWVLVGHLILVPVICQVRDRLALYCSSDHCSISGLTGSSRVATALGL